MAVGGLQQWTVCHALQGDVCVPIGLVKYPGLPSGLFAASQSGKAALSRYKVLARQTDRHSTLVEVSSDGVSAEVCAETQV
jgi:hypothetical protein